MYSGTHTRFTQGLSSGSSVVEQWGSLGRSLLSCNLSISFRIVHSSKNRSHSVIVFSGSVSQIRKKDLYYRSVKKICITDP